MNILLFSGGIESTCLAYMYRPHRCLTIDYGQRQAVGEIRASQNIAAHLGLSHEVLSVDAAFLGSGQMAGKETIKAAAIPELWPYRNQLLITLAAMRFAGNADVRIMIGSTKSDAAHVDGTSAFIEAMGKTLSIQEGSIGLIAPAIDVESIALLRTSNIDPDMLDMTFSCFQAEYPCGRCRGCLKNESLRATYYAERPTCTVAD
jgi:7-cyano-7-deazaguanine synthase